MNWVERVHRWFMEFVLFLTMLCLLEGLSFPVKIISSLFLAHTFSAAFNGHIFAMLTHDLFWISPYKSKSKFIYYVDEMYARIHRKQPAYIAGVVFFGSLSRGVFRETSDLDIRFIAKDGLWNALRTANLVFVERLHAFFSGFPIDAYMFISESEIRRKMDIKNEKPVGLYTHGKKLKEMLGEVAVYASFRAGFMTMEFNADA